MQIDFNNRFKCDAGCTCKITLDGTDFRIYEPSPFNPCWFSHKFNGPALRHEIGVCIQTGEIVWISGPYPAGSWPDLRIARDWIIYEIEEGEMILADGGHCDGHQFFMTPNGQNDDDQHMKAIARARHETINRRFKQWDILGSRWRHPLDRHGLVVRAIGSIIHFMIEERGCTEQEKNVIHGVEHKNDNPFANNHWQCILHLVSHSFSRLLSLK